MATLANSISQLCFNPCYNGNKVEPEIYGLMLQDAEF